MQLVLHFSIHPSCAEHYIHFLHPVLSNTLLVTTTATLDNLLDASISRDANMQPSQGRKINSPHAGVMGHCSLNRSAANMQNKVLPFPSLSYWHQSHQHTYVILD
jgi:hypothetical protein